MQAQLKHSLSFFVAVLALYGCQTVPLQTPGFKFELADAPVEAENGLTVTVRLVSPNESPVMNAELYTYQWSYVRNIPVRRELMAMKSNGSGNFSYTSKRMRIGDTISLAARVAPNGPLIHGVIDIH